ncbi:hypothetical protein FGO68_gene15716 [Halteria grandinella]|uniref:Uncharacterized protein n=1 Tax=Halteria grandinella TaxID=5974 RepID=A0A8J8NCH6_HALGN|nr:hypothetical protein FGO68_gene15716 [Halteria grandinella]
MRFICPGSTWTMGSVMMTGEIVFLNIYHALFLLSLDGRRSSRVELDLWNLSAAGFSAVGSTLEVWWMRFYNIRKVVNNINQRYWQLWIITIQDCDNREGFGKHQEYRLAKILYSVKSCISIILHLS